MSERDDDVKILRREVVLQRVSDERDRQEDLKANGKFKYTCADAAMSNAERNLVLNEEVGEVARAILELNELTKERETSDAGNQELQHILALENQHGLKHLKEELQQVAAVCVAWLEALESESDE